MKKKVLKSKSSGEDRCASLEKDLDASVVTEVDNNRLNSKSVNTESLLLSLNSLIKTTEPDSGK